MGSPFRCNGSGMLESLTTPHEKQSSYPCEANYKNLKTIMSKKNLQAPLVQSTYSWDSGLQDHNAWLRHCKFIIIRQTVKYI